MATPAKLLIIEDEAMLRKNLRAYFEDLGYGVVEAADGQEGVELCCRERPDLVFTDLRMPRMDGLEFISVVRKLSPDLPIIVISGAGSLRDAIEAMRLGAWDYVTKPIREMECLEIVTKRALERAELIADNASYREHLEDLVRLRSAELRESEVRFRTLFETANDAILLLRNDRIVTCNRKGLELFGFSRDEICSQSLLSFSPPLQPDGVLSSDKLEGLMHSALEGESLFYEWTHTRSNGIPFDAEISLNRLEIREAVYLQAIIRDVTIRNKKDQLIRKLSTAVAQSASIIMITDPQGNIEYVNPKFTEVTGYSAAEAIGRTPRILKSGVHSADHYGHLWQTITSGQEWRGEFCNKRKNGDTYWDWTTIAPIRNSGGAVSNFVAVKEDITEQKMYEERLYRQARFDGLTGLPNRYRLTEMLEEELERITGEGKRLYTMLLDVDNFKYINDTLGHFQGDELLRQLAGRLGELLAEGETAARFMGDEFVLVLTGLADASAAADFATRVHAAFDAPFTVGHTEFFTTACVGIAASPEDGTSAESLLRNVEAAMYQAKRQGNRQTQFFTPEINNRTNARFLLGTRLHKALDRDEFELVFQPQVELATKRINSVEALLRWSPAHGGKASPDEFIPVLEETGLIIPVGEWALLRSCLQLREWLTAGLSDIRMSVNISAWQFHSGRLPDAVRYALRESGLDPSYLCLELTESIVMRDVAETVGTLRELSEMGVLLSIDDFGTGYSSLNYLTRMPIHELKIDRSFVMEVPHNTNSSALVTTILGMASCLDLQVVAEGVETTEQLRFLERHRCLKGQGYYFSEPLPPGDFLAFASAWSERSALDRPGPDDLCREG